MIHPRDLLAVARDLATFDRRRPRQASLRRAISTAYYALFHLLIHSAVEVHVSFGPTPTHRAIAETVARWFTHTRMAEVCGQFAGPTVASKLRRALPGGPTGASGAAVSTALQGVARAFRELQEARHDADYDPSKRFSRQDALDHVDLAERAFADWEVALADPFRAVFLLLLLTGDGVIRDR